MQPIRTCAPVSDVLVSAALVPTPPVFAEPVPHQPPRLPFLPDESGMMTTFGLMLMLAMMAVGGLAVDVANAFSNRSKLQATADSVAHAAILTRERESAEVAKTKALSLAETMMPAEIYGQVVTADDIEFGTWDTEARTFTPDAGSVQAVRVSASRLAAKDNGLGTFLLQTAGVDSYDVLSDAIFLSYQPSCFSEGLVAAGPVELRSNNEFGKGFCIHSNSYVGLQNHNSFGEGAHVSMPDISKLDIPSSGYDSNPGLQDAVISSSYQFRLLNRVDEIIEGVQTYGSTYMPDYIVGSGIVRLNTSNNLTEDEFTPGFVHVRECNGNQSLSIKNGTVLNQVVLVTNCEIKFGSNVTLTDVVIATTNTDQGSISAASSLTVGRDDDCGDGGGAQIVTKGGMKFPSKLAMFGGQLIAQSDITFAANAGSIDGASMISGGKISGTSNMSMGFCGYGMEDNFEAAYFRLAQ